jgi:MFS family permease
MKTKKYGDFLMKKNFKKYFILISTSFFTISIAGTRPIIPLYSKELGASNTEIGLIITLFSLIPLFISILLGKIIDKRGSRIPLLISIFIGFFSLLIPFLFQNLIGIYISQLITGISQLLFVLSIQSYAGNVSENKVSEYYIALFSIGVALGGFIGPIVSGYLSDVYSYSFAMLISGILILFAVPFSLFLKNEDHIKDNLLKNERNVQQESKEKQSNLKMFTSFDLLKNPSIRNAIVISGVLLLGKDIYIAFFPLFAESQGISNTIIGIVISINALGGVLIRLVIPTILKRLNSNRIILLSLFIVGLLYLINPLSGNVILLTIISFLLGIFLGIGQPLSISLTIHSLPVSRVGEGLGLRLSFNKLVQVIAPVGLGGLSSIFGLISVFLLTGITILLGAFYSKKS